MILDETYIAECPVCCYSVSGPNEDRVTQRVEDHMDREHSGGHKQVIVTALHEDL